MFSAMPDTETPQFRASNEGDPIPLGDEVIRVMEILEVFEGPKPPCSVPVLNLGILAP